MAQKELSDNSLKRPESTWATNSSPLPKFCTGYKLHSDNSQKVKIELYPFMRHCGIYCPFAGFINIFISVKQKKEHTQTCPTCFRPDFYARYEFGFSKNIILFLGEINAQY